MLGIISIRRPNLVASLGALVCCALFAASSLAEGQVVPDVWQPDIDTARRVASQSNKLVLIHFYGQQCAPCRQVEAQVYSQPEFINAATAYFVLVKVDADAFPITRQQYGIDRIPTDVVTTPTGQIITKYKSPVTVKGYLDQLALVAAGTRAGAGQLATAAAAAKTSTFGGASWQGWGSNPPTTTAPSYASDHPASSPAVTATPGSAPIAPWASSGAPDYVAQRVQMANDAAQQRFAEGQQKLNGIQQYSAGYVQQGLDRGQTVIDGTKQTMNGVSQQIAGGGQQIASTSQQVAADAQQNIGAAASSGQQIVNTTMTNAGSAASAALPPWAAGNAAPTPTNSFALPSVPTPTTFPAPAAAPTFTAPPAPWSAANSPSSAGGPVAAAGSVSPWATASAVPAIAPTGSEVTAPSAATNARPGGAYLAPPSPSSPVYAPPQPSAGPPPAATLRPATSSATNPPKAPAANTAAAAPANPKPEVAAGNPPLGIDGYDVVRLVEQRKWTYGDRRWGAIHMGRTYLFSGVEEQQKFLANPNAYAPALSGNDVVAHFDEGKSIPGQRKYGIFFNQRAYLFASQEARDKFTQNADRYAAEVRQAEFQAAGTLRR